MTAPHTHAASSHTPAPPPAVARGCEVARASQCVVHLSSPGPWLRSSKRFVPMMAMRIQTCGAREVRGPASTPATQGEPSDRPTGGVVRRRTTGVVLRGGPPSRPHTRGASRRRWGAVGSAMESASMVRKSIPTAAHGEQRQSYLWPPSVCQECESPRWPGTTSRRCGKSSQLFAGSNPPTLRPSPPPC